MIEYIFWGIIGIIGGAIFSFLSYIISSKENKNIKQETEDTLKNIQNQPDYDIFKLMYKNVRESTEYYIISKRQANRSFTLSMISCILGVIIYICGFISVVILDKDIAIFTTIAGTVVELVSGLSFWMYNKSLKQLNEYHKRLSSTEKYLTSIQLAEKMESNRREDMYGWIIEKVMLSDPDCFFFKQNINQNNNTQ